MVTSATEARRELLARIPSGSELFDATWLALGETGILEALAARSDVTLLKPRLRGMDRATRGNDVRRLSQAPGFEIGGVHAMIDAWELISRRPRAFRSDPTPSAVAT
jgi:hypothetical protein